MIKHKDTIEIIGIWIATLTGLITPILPLLQFIAVCLAIAVSIKKLFFGNKSKKD